MAEREYKRLTWSRRRSTVAVVTVLRASLWLGPDHLLCIETNGYTESYKRFYFRDIQAITIRKTATRTAWSIIFAALAALFLFIGFSIQETAAIITFAVLALFLFLVPLLINLALGPTCASQIRTAVQTEDLPIGRVRRARKIMERIRPLIAAAQGQLLPEEIPVRMQELIASTNSAPVTAAAPETLRYVIDDLNLPPRIVS
jgi:hypothetical protein